MDAELNQGLDTYFSQFSSTRELVHSLILSKSHPQEILILLCSRIDALASASAIEVDAKANAFGRFLATYSGKRRLFESVSAGDLFYELDYHLWILPGMLPKAGRIHLFSRTNDAVFRLLIGSEIPLTRTDAERLIKRIQRGLRKNFRVEPSQRQSKQCLGSIDAIRAAILQEFSGERNKLQREALRKALDPLITSKTVARILYERFRCEVIHGGRVRLDEWRFFNEDEPYFTPLYSKYYGPFQFVEFPARFLALLWDNCVANYRKCLQATSKIPPNVHFEIFPDLSRLDLLDESLLPHGRTAVPK